MVKKVTCKRSLEEGEGFLHEALLSGKTFGQRSGFCEGTQLGVGLWSWRRPVWLVWRGDGKIGGGDGS